MVDASTRASRWTARVIPVFLLALIGYVSYVLVGPLCIDHLLRSGPTVAGRPPRRGPAIAVLVIFFILLLFMLSAYFRILQTLATDPGYVKRSALYRKSNPKKSHGIPKTRRRSSRSHQGSKKEKVVGGDPITGHPYTEAVESSRPSPDSEQPGLAHFYNKDVFVCEADGRPPWCSTCLEWKPDRTHHCREVGRCVRKMDHFCPWVGGIVSETNFKFFMQFVFYTSAACTLLVIVLAYFLVETRREMGSIEPQFAIAIGISGFFLLFTIGMVITTGQSVLLNTTSVENLSRKVKVWTLAVYLHNPPDPGFSPPYSTITFPLSSPKPGQPQPPRRTFAIIHSKPGENPFDIGAFGNFQTVMGYTVWDWILPIRRSPCCDHNNAISDFELGPVVRRMKEHYGIIEKRKRSRSDNQR